VQKNIQHVDFPPVMAHVSNSLPWFSPSWQQKTTQASSSPSQQGGEENQKEKAKLMGLDGNSSKEQQREKKITTILIKRIYRAQLTSQHPVSS